MASHKEGWASTLPRAYNGIQCEPRLAQEHLRHLHGASG